MNLENFIQVSTGSISPEILNVLRGSLILEIQEALNNSHDNLESFIDYFNENGSFEVILKVINLNGSKTIQIENMPLEVFDLFNSICSDKEIAQSTGHNYPYAVLINLIYKIDLFAMILSTDITKSGLGKKNNYKVFDLKVITNHFRKD